MTTQTVHIEPAAFDAQFRAGDPTATDTDHHRLAALRRLRADDAVTVADLTFALDRYDRLAAELPQIRADAARAAFADVVHDRDRDLVSRIAGPDRRELFVRFGGGGQGGDPVFTVGIQTAVAVLALVVVATLLAVFVA